MELGELLAEEAELENRMQLLQKRLLDIAPLQQGNAPILDQTALFAQYRNLAEEREQIVRWISARISLLGLQARRSRA